jgi:hypothetical protein
VIRIYSLGPLRAFEGDHYTLTICREDGTLDGLTAPTKRAAVEAAIARYGPDRLEASPELAAEATSRSPPCPRSPSASPGIGFGGPVGPVSPEPRAARLVA